MEYFKKDWTKKERLLLIVKFKSCNAVRYCMSIWPSPANLFKTTPLLDTTTYYIWQLISWTTWTLHLTPSNPHTVPDITHTHISSVNSKWCFQWHCGDKMKSCDVFLVVILAPFDWGTQRSKAFPVILIGTSTLILPFTTFLPSRSLFIYIIRNYIVILNSSPVHKHY